MLVEQPYALVIFADAQLSKVVKQQITTGAITALAPAAVVIGQADAGLQQVGVALSFVEPAFDLPQLESGDGLQALRCLVLMTDHLVPDEGCRQGDDDRGGQQQRFAQRSPCVAGGEHRGVTERRRQTGRALPPCIELCRLHG